MAKTLTKEQLTELDRRIKELREQEKINGRITAQSKFLETTLYNLVYIYKNESGMSFKYVIDTAKYLINNAQIPDEKKKHHCWKFANDMIFFRFNGFSETDIETIDKARDAIINALREENNAVYEEV